MGKSERSGFSKTLIVLAVALAVPFFRRLFFTVDPFEFVIPNFLLFTPYRDLAIKYWDRVIPDHLDTRITRGHTAVPVIDAANYSFDVLKSATENFRYPAVVRGLFKGSPATEKWATAEYLPAKIGNFLIPAIKDAVKNPLQNDREVMSFADAFAGIVENPDSKAYLFFPVQSRINTNGSEVGVAKELAAKVNAMVMEDLDLSRIWSGFGTKAHSTFVGSQLIIGQGSESSAETTGTGWHCAAGNNWFVQVAGRKRWFFMDPVYSSYMQPLRGGLVNMMTGTYKTASRMHSMPLRYADLEAGDLLYNPDWEWHTIKNYAGLSIGVPIREFNVSLSVQNNLQYTSIVIINKIAEKMGIDIGGYPGIDEK